jgi:hypothetical protein
MPGARHSSGASWSSGPFGRLRAGREPFALSEVEGSGSLMIMSAQDARGPYEHDKTRHWSGAPPAC